MATLKTRVSLRDSVATQLLKRVFFWYLGIASLVTAAYLGYLHYEAREDILRQLVRYEQTFAKGMELHLWNIERRELDAFTQGMLELPFVVGVAVVQAESGERISTAGIYADPSGRRTGALRPNEPPNAPLIAHRFRIRHQTADGPVLLGSATIYSDPAMIWQAVRSDYLWVIGSALLKTAALWAIFLWFGRRLLQRPLQDLAQATSRIRLGNLQPVILPLDDHKGDELVLLRDAFNTMLANLLAAREDLERINLTLEQKVAARTRELDENRRRLATLFGNLPGIAYRRRPGEEWSMEFMSEGCLEVTGHAAEEFLGGISSFTELIEPEDLETAHAVVERAIAARRRYHLIYRIRRADGQRRWLWEQGQAIFGQGGEVEALEGFIADVTERHQAELAANAAQLEAERANRAKSRFLANMSHEFRTPLNAILGFTEILLRRDPRPDQREHLEIVSDSGNTLLRLVDDLLDIARAEAGKIVIEAKPHSLRGLLHEALRMVRPQAEAKGLRLEWDTGEELPETVVVDPFRLRQILLNLLGNGIRYTHQGSVKLATESRWLDSGHAKACLSIHIEDTGIGIPEDERERIFEAFEQCNGQSGEARNGAGLGLAISRQLARLMNGELEMAARPGGGSIFTLTLFELEVPAVPPAPDITARHRIRFDPAKILIVDDNASNRQLLRLWLEEAGLICQEMENGESLPRIAAESPPVTILLDIKMAGVDGVVIAHRLRRRTETKRIPLIAVTAAAQPDEIERYQKDFDAYLTKPVDRDTLIETLAAFVPHRIERAQAGTPPAPEKIVTPDSETLAELRELARLGFTGRIEARTRALEREDQALIPFARELARIARTYDRDALRRFLAEQEPKT